MGLRLLESAPATGSTHRNTLLYWDTPCICRNPTLHAGSIDDCVHVSGTVHCKIAGVIGAESRRSEKSLSLYTREYPRQTNRVALSDSLASELNLHSGHCSILARGRPHHLFVMHSTSLYALHATTLFTHASFLREPPHERSFAGVGARVHCGTAHRSAPPPSTCHAMAPPQHAGLRGPPNRCPPKHMHRPVDTAPASERRPGQGAAAPQIHGAAPQIHASDS